MVAFIPFQGLGRCLPLLVVAVACNPYDNQQGEFNAGPVDAANFPKPYQGAGADTNVNGYLAGKGKFNEIAAFIGGTPAGYFSFPFSATQLASGADSLRIVEDGQSYKPVSSSPAIPVPTAYVFDPTPTSPFPLRQTCSAPPNYTYNPQTDDMRGDEQDNIFTQLPLATEKPGVAATFDYIPVVAETTASAGARACQSIKSQETLLKALPNPSLTGKYILWAIIDPSSGVYRLGQSSTYLLGDGGHDPNYSRGVGTQRWGWFGHYYLSYIDGGYIPTQTASVMEQGRTKQVVRMTAQRLYFPRTISSAAVRCGSATCAPGQVCASGSCQTCQTSGSRACPSGFTCGTSAPLTGICNANGAQGAGYDVLVARRSDANYSPVCAVWTYTANTSGSPSRPLAISELPRSEADINALPSPAPAQVTGTGRYIYCPQVD